MTTLGVRHRLVLLSTAIIVGVSFGFLVLNLRLANRWLEEDVEARVVAFARVVALTIGSRQEFESRRILAEEVRQIREARQDVLQLDVLAFQGAVTDVLATSNPGRRLPFTREDGGEVARRRVVFRSGTEGLGDRYWDVMAPIILEGSVAGAVAARFSSVPGDRLVARMQRWALLVTAASVIVMGLLMSLAVRYVVDRPIGGFRRAMARIEAGDSRATVDVSTGDEFGRLARHFNGMMARINDFSDELRRRVDGATAELDRRYREVERLNKQLFELQRNLGSAERLAVSGRIMAEVAHEVGTPLHSVAGHLELLRRDVEADGMGAHVERRLDIIEAQVARVIEIITQLLDLTRRPPAAPQPVDLNRLVREMAELVRPGASAAGLSLRVEAAGNGVRVRGVAQQLQQVLLNLLTNAIDATAPGGSVVLATRLLPERGEVEFAVADTGRGIPAADRKRVFEPFFSTKPAGRGTGLGLFISAQIVREHQGRIEVESEEGKGTRFTICLPAVPES